MIDLKVDVSGELIADFELVSVQEARKKSLRGSFLRARRGTFCLLSRTSTGTFKCRTITMLAPRPPHASRPPSRAALPPASTACHFFFNGGSTSRLLCAEPAAPTQIDENEHDGPHVSSESQVIITTDTCPIDSRALGVGWAAWFGFPCYGPALRVGRTKKESRGRARAIATTGALCSPALGESGTYPAVSGGGGGAENQNVPNDTAAPSFVANSEAARYVFVVVVIGRWCHDRGPSL